MSHTAEDAVGTLLQDNAVTDRPAPTPFIVTSGVDSFVVGNE
jgi:hypothetical protein